MSISAEGNPAKEQEAKTFQDGGRRSEKKVEDVAQSVELTAVSELHRWLVSWGACRPFHKTSVATFWLLSVLVASVLATEKLCRKRFEMKGGMKKRWKEDRKKTTGNLPVLEDFTTSGQLA